MGKKRYWTDYPIVELGDAAGKPAPIRECRPIKYDGDKYVNISVGGVETSIKRGYIYHKRARLHDDPPLLTHNQAYRHFVRPWL